jgi:uncharacterized repeat protein (TIGR01451 family)
VINIATGTGTPANASFQPIPNATEVKATDDAKVDVYLAKFSVKKTLVSPTTGAARVSEEIKFAIEVKNEGDVYLTTVPLTDLYDPAYLEYVSATVAPNSVTPGTLTWNDLTGSPNGFGMDLAPNATFTIQVTFKALKDTEGKPTVNTAKVEGAVPDLDGPDGPRPPETTPLPPLEEPEPVEILNPTGMSMGAVSVSRTGARVQLTWQTLSEAQILGFNVLRKDGGAWITVNAELILPAHAGAEVGAAYEFTDSQFGARTEYALEVVKLDGSTERIGLGSSSE